MVKPGKHCPFVRSTKDILERCMREKGMEVSSRDYFLARLPSTFDEWITNAEHV